MNIKNALGFFVLGLVMHTTPALAQSFSGSAFVADPSVRLIWMEFMSWVVGGVGVAYLALEGAVRLPALAAAILPESIFRPASQSEPVRMPQTARMAITSF